jgi:hypothetical protein
MSWLPNEIVVHLKSTGNGSAPLEELLVSLELYWRGLYYFGDLVGLTDDSGVVRITRDRILEDFALNQDLFPMDYKVPLDETDPVVGIIVRGGSEFLTLKTAVDTNPLVTPDARSAYARARNASVRTTRTQIDLLNAPRDLLPVELTLES